MYSSNWKATDYSKLLLDIDYQGELEGWIPILLVLFGGINTVTHQDDLNETIFHSSFSSSDLDTKCEGNVRDCLLCDSWYASHPLPRPSPPCTTRPTDRRSHAPLPPSELPFPFLSPISISPFQSHSQFSFRLGLFLPSHPFPYQVVALLVLSHYPADRQGLSPPPIAYSIQSTVHFFLTDDQQQTLLLPSILFPCSSNTHSLLSLQIVHFALCTCNHGLFFLYSSSPSYSHYLL